MIGADCPKVDKRSVNKVQVLASQVLLWRGIPLLSHHLSSESVCGGKDEDATSCQ